MKSLDTYKKQIKEIEALVLKLEKGELTLDELVTLEKLTAEIHEKSIILKYKAFEGHVNGPAATEEEEPAVAEVEDEAEPEAEGVEFSIFDVEEPSPEPEPVPVVQEEIVEEPEEEIPAVEESIVEEPEVTETIEEPVTEVEEEPVQEVEVVTEIKSEVTVSFWEKIKADDNSLSSQFADAKLDTLVGAFGLNQKLRYINDLFDGSSEMFSDAVKLLDSQSSIDDARNKVGELASEHSWDPEEESVVEFISFVNRRYA